MWLRSGSLYPTALPSSPRLKDGANGPSPSLCLRESCGPRARLSNPLNLVHTSTVEQRLEERIVEKSTEWIHVRLVVPSRVTAPRIPSLGGASVMLSCQIAEAEDETYGPSAAWMEATRSGIAAARKINPLDRMDGGNKPADSRMPKGEAGHKLAEPGCFPVVSDGVSRPPAGPLPLNS